MISTKGRYALRIMVDLALHDGVEPVSVREIAQRQDISGKYMEQIISVLTRAGLLRSVRGALFNDTAATEIYTLSLRVALPIWTGDLAPEEITVGMILRATEGDLAPAECVLDGAQYCDRRGACPSRTVFSKVYSAINGVIDSVTLRELMPENGETPSCSSQEKSAGSEGSL